MPSAPCELPPMSWILGVRLMRRRAPERAGVSQLLRGAVLQRDARRVRRRCRPEPGPPLRARRQSRRPVLVGRRHRKLGEPHRPRRESRTRRLLRQRLHTQHRRRDRGSQQIRSLRGPWENHDWKGWWGDTPPFHTPVFVLTHYERPSFTLSDTTFHFLNATPAQALRQGRGLVARTPCVLTMPAPSRPKGGRRNRQEEASD